MTNTNDKQAPAASAASIDTPKFREMIDESRFANMCIAEEHANGIIKHAQDFAEALAEEARREAEHQRNLLAEAIRDAAVKAGIARADAHLTGPHLLMLVSDMAEELTQRTAGGDIQRWQDVARKYTPPLSSDAMLALANSEVQFLRAALAQRPPAASAAVPGADVCAQMRALCSACGGTGDVVSITGEWRGSCDCEASKPQPVEEAVAHVDDSALRTAQELAQAIWRDAYRKDAPQFEVLDTMHGVLSQIDNMVSGMVRAAPTAQLTTPDGELPPLPAQERIAPFGCATYTAEQMRDYARAALRQPGALPDAAGLQIAITALQNAQQFLGKNRQDCFSYDQSTWDHYQKGIDAINAALAAKQAGKEAPCAN